ncbi:MAG: T9SS C-terminal target domain-containing protein [Cryomorphaceae bacterium]|nr:MAG: T9SS C-terminal target domain-containing protein [Cryomorphaceae bacterium]
MKNVLVLFAAAALLLLPCSLIAQTTVSSDMTVEEIVSQMLLGEGVEAFNITYNGLDGNQVVPRVGTFEVVGPLFPIEEGMVMTTKNVGITTCGSTSDGSGNGSDSDLLQLLNGSSTLFDVTVVEFDFIPQGDSIEFNFIFASREYHSFVCSAFNDVFGFFLSGPGIQGPFSNNAENIATLNDGSPVAINSVNNGTPAGQACTSPGTGETCPCNNEFFVDNGGTNGTGLASDICFGGFTVPLSAKSAVECGSVYHIKLAICNVADGMLDSGVFLKKGSFATIPDPNFVQCSNPDACNYNPDAICDYECIYAGCTDPAACNFNPDAGCDDGSCIYTGDVSISGHVYFDINGNGEYDTATGFTEPTLGNWEIEIMPLGLSVFTDANGYYSFTYPTGDAQTMSLVNNGTDFEPLPNSVNVPIYAPDCNGIINLGVSSTEPIFDIQTFMWNPILHCTNGFNPGLMITNIGTDSLNGTLTLTLDNALTPTLNAHFPGPAPSSIDGQTITWDVTGHPVGQLLLYNGFIEGPGVDYVGQTLSITYELTLQDDGGMEVFNDTWEQEYQVMCAYDPNDKLSDPVGYAEPHFILAGEIIEYTVRFQNTGNFPAETVLVVDELDAERFDLGTFTPLMSSHNMIASIRHEDGVAEFLFPEIYLPDSTTNEPESHGFLKFSVQTLADVPVGDVINNTAAIYFDENPPIITNTTWHTIFSCDGLAAFSALDNACAGQPLTLASDMDYIEEYTWTVNDNLAGTESELEFIPEAGEITITLEVSNPLCEVSQTLVLNLPEAPTGEIVQEGDMLTAPDGDNWQWLLNGEAIEGANQQELDVTESGLYTVLVGYGDGCAMPFDVNIITSVMSASQPEIAVYPNPTDGMATIELGNRFWNVDILDINGRMVAQWERVTDRLFLDKQQLGAGTYLIRVSNEQGEEQVLRLVVR